MSIDLISDLLILAFLERGEFAVYHSRLWRCLGAVIQNPLFITCDNATEEFWLHLEGGPEDQDTHPYNWLSAQS